MILPKLALVAVTATAMVGSAVSSATAAAPGPVFGAFVDVCGDTHADFAAVSRVSSVAAWGETDVKADSNMPGVSVTGQLARSTTVDKTGLVLSAWHGTKGAVQISDCTIHVAKADLDRLRGDASAWLGFQPQDSSAKRAAFRFTEADGAHKAVTPAEFDAAAAGGGLEILTVSGDANGTVLDLMTIKK